MTKLTTLITMMFIIWDFTFWVRICAKFRPSFMCWQWVPEVAPIIAHYGREAWVVCNWKVGGELLTNFNTVDLKYMEYVCCFESDIFRLFQTWKKVKTYERMWIFLGSTCFPSLWKWTRPQDVAMLTWTACKHGDQQENLRNIFNVSDWGIYSVQT